MVPGEQGIATKESDMSQQKLVWSGAPLSVQLQQELAAKLKLLGEHETYKWEYDTCLEKIALFQRLLDKRQVARHLSSSTKPHP